MPSRDRYQEIAERFERLVRTRLGRLERLSDISDAIAVTPRTLARAVRAIHGTTPRQYVRTLRLIEANRVLSSPQGRSETVTDVAMRCGFRQLSRFAADYRATFGESPSETLRRASGLSSALDPEASDRGEFVCEQARACQHRDAS